MLIYSIYLPSLIEIFYNTRVSLSTQWQPLSGRQLPCDLAQQEAAHCRGITLQLHLCQPEVTEQL